MFVWPLRVYYEDTDAGGVVYYANYLKFMERARTECLREKGIEQDQLRAQHDCLFVVRRCSLEFIKPALFNDQLFVSCQVQTRKRASVIFTQQVWRGAKSVAEGELLSQAEVQIASIADSTGRPKAIPTDLLEVL